MTRIHAAFLIRAVIQAAVAFLVALLVFGLMHRVRIARPYKVTVYTNETILVGEGLVK